MKNWLFAFLMLAGVSARAEVLSLDVQAVITDQRYFDAVKSARRAVAAVGPSRVVLFGDLTRAHLVTERYILNMPVYAQEPVIPPTTPVKVGDIVAHFVRNEPTQLPVIDGIYFKPEATLP